MAVESGSIEALRKLIALGANLHAKTCDGRTPLHVAIWDYQVDVVQILLDSGSDAFAVDNEGKTPYDLACKPKSPELLIMGRERQPKVMEILRSHMDIDEDEAEVESFVTAYSRSEKRAEVDETDHISELVTPRQSIDLDASRPSVEA